MTLRGKARAAAERAIKAGAALLVAEVGATLAAGNPGRGRVYKRGNVSHQASAPGDAPASDTGNLRQSITAEIRDGGLSARVGPALGDDPNYAVFLEYGTRKMAARPFLRPTAARVKEQLGETMRKAFKAGMG